jgi:hypothetical protein
MPVLFYAPKLKRRFQQLKQLKKYCEYFIYILIGSAIILLYMNYIQIKTLNDALGGY